MASGNDAELAVTWSDQGACFSNGLQELLCNKKFVDVTLAADGVLMNAHRLILSVCSPLFEQMFSTMPSNQQAYVFLKDVPQTVLKDLIQFMYCGEVGVKEEDLSTFLNFGKALKIKGLQDVTESLVAPVRDPVQIERRPTSKRNRQSSDVNVYAGLKRPRTAPTPNSTPGSSRFLSSTPKPRDHSRESRSEFGIGEGYQRNFGQSFQMNDYNGSVDLNRLRTTPTPNATPRSSRYSSNTPQKQRDHSRESRSEYSVGDGNQHNFQHSFQSSDSNSYAELNRPEATPMPTPSATQRPIRSSSRAPKPRDHSREGYQHDYCQGVNGENYGYDLGGPSSYDETIFGDQNQGDMDYEDYDDDRDPDYENEQPKFQYNDTQSDDDDDQASEAPSTSTTASKSANVSSAQDNQAAAIRAEVHSEFEQYELNSDTGLYFEELADLQVYHSEWTFVTYVNLSYFAVESEHLEQTNSKIQNFCDKIKQEFVLPIPNLYCEHTLPQLNNLMEEIREYSTKWFINQESRNENDFHRYRRKKRGLFGAISKHLFGTLSVDDGDYYMEQIRMLKTENLQQLLMAEKQTTLFQESLKVLNNTMQAQNIQNSALQKQFDDLNLVLNNATKWAAVAEASSALLSKLTELMQYVSFLVIGFREKQRYFFEAITTKSKSFQLIPPRMFMSELERVSLLVASQGLQLPLPLIGENLAKFYQITTTEGRIVNNSLVVRFSMPLVEAKKFLLFKATSAPHRNGTNSTFSFIVPRNEYIAVDSFKEKFLTLTLEEIKNCHRIHSRSLVCKQTFPIMTASNDLGCEINLLRNTNLTAGCDFRKANLTEELWVQLQEPNNYLYTLPKIQTVSIVCSHSRTSLQLEGTGIIAVAQRCRIKTQHIEIVAFQIIKSKIFRSLAPSTKFHVNVSSEIGKAKQMKGFQIPNLKIPNLISGDDPMKVSKISTGLNDLQEQNAIGNASAMNFLNTAMTQSKDYIGHVLVVLAVVGISFTCVKYSIIKGGNLIAFIVLVALATSGLLYIM